MATSKVTTLCGAALALMTLAGCASDSPHYYGSHGHDGEGVIVVRDYIPVVQVQPQAWGHFRFVPGYANQGVVVSPSRTWTYGQGQGWGAHHHARHRDSIGIGAMTGKTFSHSGHHTESLSGSLPDSHTTRYHFAFDKSHITEIGKRALRQQAPHLKQVFAANPTAHARIVGFTDSTGSTSYNQQLSQRRADAVRAYLIRLGVPASRLDATGRGPREPMASNATKTGRLDNRRVEIRIVGDSVPRESHNQPAPTHTPSSDDYGAGFDQ